MIGDADAVFIDTNILVYANVSESPFHEAALQAIQSRYDAGIELWISRQVLRFLMTVTRPQAYMNPRPIAIVIERVRFFQSQFQVGEDNLLVTFSKWAFSYHLSLLLPLVQYHNQTL